MRSSGLPVFLRLDGRPVLLVGTGPAADAKRRLIERAGARVVTQVESGVAIAFIACDDPDPIAADLKAQGLLLNVADRPDLCDFTLPAIIDRDPVTIAIGTGGASAGLAAALRQRLEPVIPARLGELALGLAQARAAMRERWSDGGTRRRALSAAFQGPLDPLAELGADAVQNWLKDAGTPPDQWVQILLTSDDPDDLTLRQARYLAQAEFITHRPNVPVAILDRARADAQRIACDAPIRGLSGLTVDIGFSA